MEFSIKHIFVCIEIAVAALGSTVAGLLGGWDIMLKLLLTMTIMDFVTGVLGAIYHKTLSSKIAASGIIRKIGIYVIVGMAVALDSVFGSTDMLRGAAIGFYIASEGISILENWGGMGLPLPKAIKKTLEQLKDKTDKADDGEE